MKMKFKIEPLKIVWFIIIFIIVLGISILVIYEIEDAASEMIDDEYCYEFGEVKYRYEGTRGLLFGGVSKIRLDKTATNYDVIETECIKGLNIFGKYTVIQ